MAKKPPSKKERDQNLDDLQKALDDWAKKEQDRLENEVKFMRSVLKGRTGSDTASTQNLSAASKLLENEVSAFIEFGGDSQRS